MSILVTGGTGFIGSHTTVELINAGYDVVIIDNLVNSCKGVIDRIEKITASVRAFMKTICWTKPRSKRCLKKMRSKRSSISPV